MRCEDFPCCGHTPADPCDDTGLRVDDYYTLMSHPDYDDYYDQGDY